MRQEAERRTDRKKDFSHLKESIYIYICVSVHYVLNISAASHCRFILLVRRNTDIVQLRECSAKKIRCLTAKHQKCSKRSVHLKGNIFFFKWDLFKVVKYVFMSVQFSSISLFFLPALLAVSPHRWRADGHLLQVTH